MNKILQGVLLLDTETSKILKKDGEICTVIDDMQIRVTMNENKDITFDVISLCKPIDWKVAEEGEVIFTRDEWTSLCLGQEVKKGRKKYYLVDNKVYDSKITPISKVVYR